MFKRHPLQDKEFLLLMLNTVPPSQIYEYTNRRTGRTTALALRYLSEAISNPHKPIEVKDHHDTKFAHDSLLRLMIEMADRLGLKYMVFNRGRGTVTFTDDPKA